MKKNLTQMQSLPPLTLNQRTLKLKRLAKVILQRKHEIIQAISQDFNHRSTHESLLAEIMLCVEEIKFTLKNIKQWVRPKTWHSDWKSFPSKCSVSPQPKGVVGIMAPWNYPFNLVIEPLIAAIAAGNRALIKPSEITPVTAELTKQLLSDVFDEDEVLVILGGIDVANEFSCLPLDHILFTGSTQVGKIIMNNASQNLTPLTLELGGKSPVLIDEAYSIKKAAKSIVAGKWFNAGQTCLAPDYILISENRKSELIKELSREIEHAFPEPSTNPDYSCVINPKHKQRLTDLFSGIDENSIVQIGKTGETQKIAPTLIIDPPLDHAIMNNEIFGPILPIVTSKNLKESIDFINDRDKPLTLYLFSNSSNTIKTIREKTQSGSLAINETLLHFAQQNLPFGGIGMSGMGSYHGYQGFVEMSHMKSIYYQSKLNFNNMVRAPYNQMKEKIITLLSH